MTPPSCCRPVSGGMPGFPFQDSTVHSIHHLPAIMMLLSRSHGVLWGVDSDALRAGDGAGRACPLGETEEKKRPPGLKPRRSSG
jgi:hypothetical protein